jgi:carbonic anhydrase/acetyltransferase-like protein (isoleucine patch superfamily)
MIREMGGIGNGRRFVASSDHWAARLLRHVYRSIANFTLPAPGALTKPALALVLLIRNTYFFLVRVFFCEPLFKAYCTSYGRNVHTGVFLHWVHGSGELILGDNVCVDGKCSFTFAVRYAEKPRLTVGDNTRIGHDCSFTIGKQITIGRHCLLGSSVYLFDAPGHPTDPAARLAGLPSRVEDVRPITIGDNVWIGAGAIIYPGVTIGDDSVVATGSVVMANVAPQTIVAGNPARQIASLSKS